MPSWLTAVPQERSHTAEAKLLETTAQLEELQVRQRHLEARNLLLEKVARLNKQTVLREAHEPVPLPWEVSPWIRLTTVCCAFPTCCTACANASACTGQNAPAG